MNGDIAVQETMAGEDGVAWLPPLRPGKLQVRALESAVFLVRHPGAAFLVRWWSAPADPEAREQWVLQPSAAPLFVHVRQIWDEPVPFAQLTLRVGDLWLSGGTLAWLTSSRAVADASGFWRGQHLPTVTLEIVASARDASSGPPMAVQPPWPEPLELVVAHVSP